MPHEGFADPVTNDGPRFHSNMPVSELTERITQAIRTSDVSSTPSVAETLIGASITKMNQPSTELLLCVGLEESWNRTETEHAVVERWLRS